VLAKQTSLFAQTISFLLLISDTKRMPKPDATLTTRGGGLAQDEMSTITLVVATVCLVWYIAVAMVCTVGYVQMY
jgi:hypothetical protein